MSQRAPAFALRCAFLASLLPSLPVLATSTFCGALAVTLSGCGSTPTLPLPPPVALVGAPNSQGLVRVSGQANDEAYVTVLNEDTEEGRIKKAAADGHFEIDIAASPGDTLTISQQRDGLLGEASSQTVPAP